MKLLILILLFPVLAFSQDSLFIVPGLNPQNDGKGVTLGVVFRTDTVGKLSAIKFWKTVASDQSVYQVSLWSSAGQRLLSKNYSSNTAGWQSVVLDSEFSLVPNTNYIASFYSPKGLYAQSEHYFETVRKSGHLTAPSSAETTNGKYINSNGFPAWGYLNSNYFVDVVVKYDKPVPVRKALIVNAGPDRLIIAPIDSSGIDSIQLNGFVSGDSVSYSWKRVGVNGFGDTLIKAESLNPVIKDMPISTVIYRLTATDKWGNTASSDVAVTVDRNPKSTMIRILYDGTWQFQGANTKGFEVEEFP